MNQNKREKININYEGEAKKEELKKTNIENKKHKENTVHSKLESQIKISDHWTIYDNSINIKTKQQLKKD